MMKVILKKNFKFNNRNNNRSPNSKIAIIKGIEDPSIREIQDRLFQNFKANL